MSTTVLGNVPANWSIAETGDHNGAGRNDIFWIGNLGHVAVWFLNGVQVSQSDFAGNVLTVWTTQGLNAD